MLRKDAARNLTPNQAILFISWCNSRKHWTNSSRSFLLDGPAGQSRGGTEKLKSIWSSEWSLSINYYRKLKNNTHGMFGVKSGGKEFAVIGMQNLSNTDMPIKIWDGDY